MEILRLCPPRDFDRINRYINHVSVFQFATDSIHMSIRNAYVVLMWINRLEKILAYCVCFTSKVLWVCGFIIFCAGNKVAKFWSPDYWFHVKRVVFIKPTIKNFHQRSHSNFFSDKVVRYQEVCSKLSKPKLKLYIQCVYG